MKIELAKDIYNLTKDAVQKVGSYRFMNEGPDEFINVARLANEFRRTTILDKVQIAQELKEHAESTETLIAVIAEVEDDISPEDIRRIAQSGSARLMEFYGDLFEEKSDGDDGYDDGEDTDLY